MTPTPETIAELRRLLAEATRYGAFDWNEIHAVHWRGNRARLLEGTPETDAYVRALAIAAPDLIEAAEETLALRAEIAYIKPYLDDQHDVNLLRAELATVREIHRGALEAATRVGDSLRAELARVREVVRVYVERVRPYVAPLAQRVDVWLALKGVAEQRDETKE